MTHEERINLQKEIQTMEQPKTDEKCIPALPNKEMFYFVQHYKNGGFCQNIWRIRRIFVIRLTDRPIIDQNRTYVKIRVIIIVHQANFYVCELSHEIIVRQKCSPDRLNEHFKRAKRWSIFTMIHINSAYAFRQKPEVPIG